MLPLSCLNCCHNPLQLGPVGTAFGYCTRHAVVLTHPHMTTCGQLLRKDVLAESAEKERRTHAKGFASEHVVLLRSPKTRALTANFAERPNGQLLRDPVVEEVTNYGLVDRKIGTMAALRRIPGTRAEIAMLSLSRSYFANCVRRGGKWTAGVHLAFWTLDRLESEPQLEATDIRGPIAFSLGKTIAIAKWMVIALRLSFLSDVGAKARGAHDPAGRFVGLVMQTVRDASVEDPGKVIASLKRARKSWRGALSEKRYALLQKKLHKDAAEES